MTLFKNIKISTYIVILFIFSPSLVFSQSFGILSNQEKLKMTAILDAGNAEKITVDTGKIGATYIIKINNRCFEPIGFNHSLITWFNGKKAVLLVIDQTKTLKIAIIKTDPIDIGIDLFSVTQIECSGNARN